LTLNEITALPADLEECSNSKYDWEESCYQDKTDNGIKYSLRLYSNTNNPLDTIEQWFDEELNSIPKPSNIEKCQENTKITITHSGCYDTGSGLVKLDGVKLIDHLNNESYYLTVSESSDTSYTLDSTVTDISTFTRVDCICKNC
jgi:hypothetical protein